jgi:hypothetical protein
MRLTAALALALATGLIFFTGAVGAFGSVPAGAVAAAVAAAAAGVLLWRWPPVDLDAAAAPRALRVVSLLAVVVALVQLARLSIFIVDASQTSYSTVPSSRWEILHSCVTAYFVAGEAAGRVSNVFADDLYSLPGDSSAPRRPRMLDGFRVDVYEYPPPFLLLPRALRLAAPDFLRFRALWFAVNAAVVLAVMVAVARSFGPAVGTRVFLLSPLVWASLTLTNAFQKENVQMLVVALSVLGLLLFERRRWAAGGFVLAFAIASKLYPGMLVVYLLFRRRWRAVFWTAAFGVAIILVSLLDTGWAPYAAFLRHLPALLSGEAFPAFRNPAAAAINFSIPGLAFKLRLFGVPGMGYGAAKLLGWISTLAALALIVRAARGSGGRDDPRTWLAIVVLATLCSPFLPQAYACFPPLWLLTLLVAARTPDARVLAGTLLAWTVLSALVPNDAALDPRVIALLVLPPQALTVALAVVGVVGRLHPAESEQKARPAFA